jgi:signal transduction histidine kinase
LHFSAWILVYFHEDIPDMESRPKKIRTQDRSVVLPIPEDQPVTSIQAKFSRGSNFTKTVRWRKGDPIPSDYGIHREFPAKLFPKVMWKQRGQRTRYQDTMEARARSVAVPQLCNPSFLFTKGKDRLGFEIKPTIQQSQLAESLPCSAVIEERNRLAREIHDTLAQQFAGILLHLEAANGLDGGVNARECLAQARELAKSGLEDARRMLLGLRPKSLEGAHLSDALSQLVERFSRDCGINCTFSASGRPLKLSEEIENELYRVAQEALCNVRKHSRAGSVAILLNYQSDGVVLAIKDNGQGFAVNQRQAGAHGFGLPTMCERANRLGGKMDINTGQGTGTEIRMSVPLSGKTSKERNNQ